MSDSPFAETAYKELRFVEDDAVPDGSAYMPTNKMWAKYAPRGLFGLPYKLETNENYQYYAGQSRDDYPTLHAPVIGSDDAADAHSFSVASLIDLAGAVKQEEKVTVDQKDLIIELMAAEIERGRNALTEANGRYHRLMQDCKAEANKNRNLEQIIETGKAENARLCKRVEAAEASAKQQLFLRDEADRKIDRLEAALAKCKKTGKKASKKA